MAHPARFELTTSAFGGQRSIQLSYGCMRKQNATISDIALARSAQGGSGRPMDGRGGFPMSSTAAVDARAGSEDLRDQLERRLGRLYARQRLGIEDDREASVFGRGLNYFHPENWYLSPPIVRTLLQLSGLYWRARKNAARIEVRHNDIAVAALPRTFDGYTILHLSDLHVDLNPEAMQRLAELLPRARYDLCVLTGDYRGRTHGSYAATLDGMRRLMACLEGPVYGVLGNHDSIRMVPALEAMGIRMLLNEAAALIR